MAWNRLVSTFEAALVLILGWTSLAVAQETRIPFRHLTIRQGLSQSTVNAIVQDHQGFIWLGTQDGLARYDGRRFVVFRHDRDDPGSLADNWIWSLLVDRDGTLWVGTDGGGLDRWDQERRAFAHLVNAESDPSSLSNNRVRVVRQDSDGAIWIGTEGGLNRLDPETGGIDRLLHDPSNEKSLSHDQIRDVWEDSEGRLWVATNGGGVSVLDRGSSAFEHFRHRPDDSRSLSDDRVRTVYEDDEGTIWIGTYEGGLNRRFRESDGFERFQHDPEDPTSLSDNRIRTVFQSRQRTIWVGTDQGLNAWLPERQRFVRYEHNPADPTSLSGDRVTEIIQDRGGVLWVGTYGGVSTWNETTGSFSGYRHDPENPERSLADNSINAFAEDESGALWVGTYGGLDRIDRVTGRVEHFRADAADPRALRDERVFALLRDSRGSLWVGTFEGGLHRREPGQDRFRAYQQDPNVSGSLSRNAVTTISEDVAGVIWVGTYGGGLNRYDGESDSFVAYRHDPTSATSLGADEVLALLEDSSGTLWVGTDGAGLNGFDRASGSFTRYRFRQDDPASLSHDTVFSLFEDEEGTLWIGTQGGGLNRWSKEDRDAHRGIFRRYTSKDGLANDVVYAILADDEGRLWMSTNNGLSRFDPRSETFRNFDSSHGLLSREFNFAAAYRSKSGEMFFGGIEGFNAFLPDSIRGNSYRPPLVLTAFLKFNKEVETEIPVSMLDTVELSRDDYVVSFEFAALDYTAPEKNRYAYRLEGFDADWNDLGSLNRATYTNLDPGSYVLRVRGSNSDGVWGEEELTVGIHVAPPPWRTWWAYSLYGIAVLGAIARVQVKRTREREQQETQRRALEEQVAGRTRELAEKNVDLQQAIELLELASVTDSLTGLHNRRYLINTIEQDLALVDRFHERRRRNPEEKVTELQPDFLFLMFDLDGFKEVNDSYGHGAGDRVLVQVRNLLEEVCRRSDTVTRWGGDEFLLIARHADRVSAERLAERIRLSVQDHPFDIGRNEPRHLTCSIGFAYYPFMSDRPSQLTWEQIVTIADRALYIAKNNGRNAWVGIYETGQSSKLDPAGLVRAVNERLDELVAEDIVRLRSSLQEDEGFAWALG